MKVLVFGATGYLGDQIVRNLVASGDNVTGFVRNGSSGRVIGDFGAQVVLGDLNDTASIPSLVAGYDAVILAAQLMLDDELRVTTTILDTHAGTERAFIFTSGTSLMSIPTNGDWDERSFAKMNCSSRDGRLRRASSRKS